MSGQIKITADVSQAEKELAKLDKALDNLSTSAGNFGKFFAGITATAGAVAYGIKGVLDSAGALVDAANAIGVGADQLLLLQQSAELAGIGAEQLNAGLVRLSKNIGEALIKGGDEATAAFTRLGINLDTLRSKNPVEQFEAISAALLNIPDRATRSALAIELLGKQGPALLAAAENTKRLKEQMESLGLSITKIDTAALDSAGDSVTELTQIFNNALKKAVAEIAPYIIGIVEAIKDAIREAGGFEAVWGKIKQAIREVINFVVILGGLMVARLVGTAIALVAQLYLARGAMATIVTLMMRTPIGLLAAGATLLASKLGLDVVGAMGDVVDMTALGARGQAVITENVKATAKALETTTTAAAGFTTEQQKALKALEDTIGKLQNQNQYQKDILKYGEQEADVRKIIKEESDKLAKVGLVLSSQAEQRIRDTVAEEQATKRIITLRKEQGNIAMASFTPKSSVGKAFDELADLRSSFEEKMSAEDIQRRKADQALAVDQVIFARTGTNGVIQNKQVEINKIVAAEVGKNNRLVALQESYKKNVDELNDIMFYHQGGLLELSAEQVQAINKAKLNLDNQYTLDKMRLGDEAAQFELDKMRLQLSQVNQYTMEKMRIESEAFANFSQFKDMEIQREAEMYADKLRMQKDFLGNAVFSNETIKQIASDRAAFEKKTDLERVQFGIDQGQTLFAALGAENRKAFEASKALAVASAIVNTYQGATKALATYPWPFGLIAAAAAVAAGFAQVNAIKSQQYTGRALGGPVSEGRSYIVGEQGPEMFTPGAAGNITPNNQMSGGVTNVNFTIVANDTTGFDQLLTSRRGMIQQIVSDAMLEKGQRM